MWRFWDACWTILVKEVALERLKKAANLLDPSTARWPCEWAETIPCEPKNAPGKSHQTGQPDQGQTANGTRFNQKVAGKLRVPSANSRVFAGCGTWKVRATFQSECPWANGSEVNRFAHCLEQAPSMRAFGTVNAKSSHAGD